MKWPNKDPNEVADFDIDWTIRLYSEAELLQYNAALAADPSLADALPLTVVTPVDTIASSQFTLPIDLVAQSSTYTSWLTKLWLTASGVEGATYEVLNRVVTSGGRTFDQTVKLKIKSK